MSSRSNEWRVTSGEWRVNRTCRARARGRPIPLGTCHSPLATFSALIGILLLTACERENRRFQENPPTATPTSTALIVSDLQPGPAMVIPKVDAPYDDNAWAVSEGKNLFNSMNCSGCHFQGGGGIGPALMDEEWIYGSEPQQIFASIADGRPNGMPAWKYTLSTQQVWQLVSYVRSLSGLNPKGARSGRDDHMMRKTPEASTPNAVPKMSSTPPED
jgi:cytochrome c oxidase cbb3-type subunit 3